jgi:hypothetical protein
MSKRSQREPAHTGGGARADSGRLPPPRVDAVVPDIAGGEPNLLPIAALQKPLEVEVPMWQNSSPMPGFPEKVWLYWNQVQVAEREFTQPVTPQDRMFSVPPAHLVHGTHDLHYQVMTFNEEVAASQGLPLSVDTAAPVLAAAAGRLQFPQAIIDGGLSADYLDENGDRVVARVPPYQSPRPGDVITWYWDTVRDDDDRVDARTLALADIDTPIDLAFTGAMIRERGDGTRLVRYRVQDRAGNMSDYAGYVTLEVETTSRPRDLAWPTVSEATGSAEQLTLDPLRATSGVTAVIPDNADIRPDDREVWVQWGTAGTVGAFRTQTPISAGGRAYRIPKEAVAAHIGKVLPVRYEIVDKGGALHVSQPRSVKVNVIPSSNLPTVQCAGVSGGSLSLASVPAAGARLTLAKWVLISTDQCVTLKVEGISTAGNAVNTVVLDRHRVSAQEVIDGLGKNGDVLIPRSVLAGLKLNAPFNVTVWVSFDAGGSWPVVANFPRLSPNLMA